MKMPRRIHPIAIVLTVIGLFHVTTALAVPTVLQNTDTDGDTTVTLRLFSEAIAGDVFSWCEAGIQILGDDVLLTAGDSAALSVLEDDGILGTETLWQTSLVVTADEATAQLVDRTFDCSADFGVDTGSSLEIFATAEVTKDECGVFCAQDNPQTANVSILLVSDDSAEEDDDKGAAVFVLGGTTADRIANDGADWFEFELSIPTAIEIAVVHRPSAGRISALLEDEAGHEIGTFSDDDDATRLNDSLGAGTWFVRVEPEVASDPNFYDLQIVIDCEVESLDFDTILEPTTIEACHTLVLGPLLAVSGPNGALTARAGDTVVFEDGVDIGVGAELTVEIDPSLLTP